MNNFEIKMKFLRANNLEEIKQPSILTFFRFRSFFFGITGHLMLTGGIMFIVGIMAFFIVPVCVGGIVIVFH